MAGIICRNSDAVEYSQPFVMRKVGSGNEIVNCRQLDQFQFKPWKSKGTSGSSSQPRFQNQPFIKVATEQIKVLAFAANASTNAAPDDDINYSETETEANL